MRRLACALLVPAALLAPPCLAQDFGAYDPMLATMGAEEPINVARMSDSDLSCEQLYAESVVIEQRMAAAPRPEDPTAMAARMQQEMLGEVQKQQSAMRARSVASSVLSMVPGVGGLASSALAPRGMDTSHMDEQMTGYMQQMQQMQTQMRALAEQEARRAHVTNLFLSRGCKVSALDQTRVQAARRALGDGSALAAASNTDTATPPAHAADAGIVPEGTQASVAADSAAAPTESDTPAPSGG